MATCPLWAPYVSESIKKGVNAYTVMIYGNQSYMFEIFGD